MYNYHNLLRLFLVPMRAYDENKKKFDPSQKKKTFVFTLLLFEWHLLVVITTIMIHSFTIHKKTKWKLSRFFSLSLIQESTFVSYAHLFQENEIDHSLQSLLEISIWGNQKSTSTSYNFFLYLPTNSNATSTVCMCKEINIHYGCECIWECKFLYIPSTYILTKKEIRIEGSGLLYKKKKTINPLNQKSCCYEHEVSYVRYIS